MTTQQYSFDIRNYTMELYSYESRVYVAFTIRPFGANEFFGGGARYVLDEKTRAILEITGER